MSVAFVNRSPLVFPRPPAPSLPQSTPQCSRLSRQTTRQQVDRWRRFAERCVLSKSEQQQRLRRVRCCCCANHTAVDALCLPASNTNLLVSCPFLSIHLALLSHAAFFIPNAHPNRTPHNCALLRSQFALLRQRWHIILCCLVLQYVHGIATQLAYRMHRPAQQPLHDLGFELLPVSTHCSW